MQCPNCKRENRVAINFCVFCGSHLPGPETEYQSDTLYRADTSLPPLPTLKDEVNRLKDLVVIMSERISTLEGKRGITASVHRPVVESPAIAPSGVTQTTEQESPFRSQKLPQREVVKREPIEWEQILGGNWMTRIGVFTLVLGVAFFLKLAFDNGWSVPGVIVGISAGLALMVGGYHWQKQYPVFAQALTGGGLAYLYLSIYAALAVFHLISVYPALIAVLLVSLLSATLAVRRDSMALAVLGIVGAFSAPLILGYQASGGLGSSPVGHGIQIIAYVLIVDIGVLVLSSFRTWRWLTLIALVGSFLSYALWYSRFGAGASLLTSEVSLTLIFLIFVGVSTLFHIVWRRVSSSADYALMVLNAGYYFGVSYGLMWTPLRAWIGCFSLVLAVFYGGLAYAASRRGMERLSIFATGIALVFLTVAIPVQLGDRAATTIAWATEAAVLMWFYLRLRLSQYQIYSYIAFALVSLRVLVLDTPVDRFVPVINSRVLAFLFVIGAMYLVAYLTWRDDKIHPLPESKKLSAYPIFLLGANFFSLWLIGAEVISYRYPVPEGNLTFIFLIFMAGVTTLYHLVWRRPLKLFDMVALAISAVFYFGMGGQLWGYFRNYMGSFYLLLAVIYGSLAYVLLRRVKERGLFADIILGIALAFFTVAIPSQFTDQIWTPIVWATEMAALMWLSFMFPMTKFRAYSYAVSVIMAARILLFDTAVAPDTYRPILNERFLAFIVAIAATYLTGFQLWRRRQESPELRTPASTFFIAANIYSLWLLSFEVWDYFARSASDNMRNAQGLSLTALWASYAVVLLVIGIVKRWRQVRLWALALLVVPIIKLFLYDVFALQLLYRIIAFASLGILLLAGGYLYQRYSRRIRGLVSKN